MQPKARSASSSTMVADFPPSSRKRRFIVAAPFSMIPCPTAVEPVNEMRSTFGEIVGLFTDKMIGRRHDVDPSRGDVGVVGDQPAQTCCIEGRVRCRLKDDRVAGGERLAEFLNGDFEREVPWHDRADDPHRFAPHVARGVDPRHRYDRIPERESPRIGVDEGSGNRNASANGASSCGPCVSARGQPTSRMSSSRSSSRSASIASWSCCRQRDESRGS